MGPIKIALDAISEARRAMRDRDLVTAEECRICSRLIDGGFTHAPDCAYLLLENAERALLHFQKYVTS